jgi:drug/metabolite transporter (DMT)-like permease
MPGITFLVAAAAVLWGANFNLSQAVLAEMHPLAAGATRFVLAAAVMVALAVARGERVPLVRHAGPYAVLGTVGIAGFNLMFFWALTLTGPVNAALIMATNPLVTALLAAMVLGERPSSRQMMALPVALAGVAAVVLGRPGASLHPASGDVLMMGANLAWAVYNVVGKRLMPTGSGLANSAGVMVAGAVVMVAALLLSGAPVAMPGARAQLAMVGMALGGTVLAYLFWNAGLARLGAARTSLFLNLVPVTAMTIEALCGRPPSLLQAAGAVAVLGAVSVAMLPQPPRKRLA